MKPTGLSSSPEQEYPYGWRYVKRVQADGSETLDQVALTLEDVLHPQEGDVIPENTDHDADCVYLATIFRDRPLSPPFAFVSHDLLVDWGVPGIRNHSPDLAVFVGLSRDPRPTGLLDLAAFGGRCELIVEVVSPSTRDNDVVHKFDHYHRIGIPIYVIIDQEKEDGPRRLRAYQRKSTYYAEIESDDKDRVDLPLLGLMIGMRDGRAVCYDLRTYEEVGDYSRITSDLEEAKRLLEAADRRAEQQEQAMEEQVEARQKAERQAADAQSEADRQRREADSRRLEADKRRLEAERAQQETDKHRLEADKQRLEADRHRLEADNRRLEAERAQKEADRQREEADRQREEADRQRQEADNQRRAREELENRQKVAEEQAALLIRELQEKLRLLQAGGSADPTSSA